MDTELNTKAEKNTITFCTSDSSAEMLRISPDGFYVRGIKVPANDQEARVVYRAFKQWLAWAQLTQKG